MSSILLLPSSRFPGAPGSSALGKYAAIGMGLVWLALLLGLLGRFFWLFDLFAHFRAQYAVLLLAFAAILLFTGRRMLGVLSASGSLLSVLPLVPYFGFAPATAAASDAPQFRLVTFNVWYRNEDLVQLAEFVATSQADAVVLQELAGPKARGVHALLPPDWNMFAVEDWHGAAVFTRWPLRSAESMPLAPVSGAANAARVVIDWRGSAVTVLGVHLHWPLGARNAELRNEELAGLAAFARAHQGPLLVAGDFNLTPWSRHFRVLLARSGLQDASLGEAIAPSWPSQFPPLGIPIDHCLVSAHWRALEVAVGRQPGSDHRPLTIELQLAAAPVTSNRSRAE